MRKITKKKTFWRCSVCRTDYTKKSVAERCEGNPIEQKKFEIGDRVTNCMEPRTCASFGGSSEGNYRFDGRISKIMGPLPPDEEYWNKWLGGLPKRHVFYYEVAYQCPKCGMEKEAAYFAPELEKIK